MNKHSNGTTLENSYKINENGVDDRFFSCKKGSRCV